MRCPDLSQGLVIANLARTIDEEVLAPAENGQEPNTTLRGTRLCSWFLTNVYELTTDQADEAQEASGPGDKGIDAIFDKDDILYLVQSKYGTSHSKKEMDAFYYKMQELMHQISDATRIAVRRAAQRVHDAIESGTPIVLIYVTNEKLDKSAAQRMENTWRNTTKGARIEFIGIDEIQNRLTRRLVDVPDWYYEKSHTFTLDRQPLVIGEGDGQSVVCSLRLARVAQFAHETQPYLYTSNIRHYLKRTQVNRSIEKTLSTEPQNFWFYNNGLTIMCKKLELKGLELKVYGPQVLNGCQTVVSIERFFLSDRVPKADRESYPGSVMVRFIPESAGVSKNDLTWNTNNQNAVRGKDFLSLNEFQRKLQETAANHGFYYETQRGAYAALSVKEKKRFSGGVVFGRPAEFQYIPAIEALQGYAAAFHDMAGTAYARPGELSPLGEDYDKVITSNLDPSECWEQFLYPFAAARYAEKRLSYGRQGQEGFRRYSKWFFCTAVMEASAELVRKATGNKAFQVPGLKGETLRLLFEDSSAADRLFKLTDIALKQFFNDTVIYARTKEGQDERNFLKSGCSDAESKSILQRYIRSVLDESEGRQLVKDVKPILMSNIDETKIAG